MAAATAVCSTCVQVRRELAFHSEPALYRSESRKGTIIQRELKREDRPRMSVGPVSTSSR